ncbi:MAG: hypothetical protein R2697_20150 [Ilumatobacteraceae bacterium]
MRCLTNAWVSIIGADVEVDGFGGEELQVEIDQVHPRPDRRRTRGCELLAVAEFWTDTAGDVAVLLASKSTSGSWRGDVRQTSSSSSRSSSLTLAAVSVASNSSARRGAMFVLGDDQRVVARLGDRCRHRALNERSLRRTSDEHRRQRGRAVRTRRRPTSAAR